MPSPVMTEDMLAEALRLVDEHGSVSAAARALELPRSTFKDRYARAKDRVAALRGEVGGPPIPPAAKPPEGFEVFRNSGAYDADGNLLRQWVGTKQAPGLEYSIPAGHTVKGESTLVDPTGRVLAKWIKTREGAGEGLVDALREAFSSYAGAAPYISPPDTSDDELLTVYPLPDLHFGMLSWKAETGTDYDVKIASEVALRSLQQLVAQSRSSRRAVLLVLGDFFHANDSKAVTPGSGHRLDVDGRWAKVYLAGCRLLMSLVTTLAEKHEEIDLVVLPGNHDEDSAVTLGVALALFYESNPRIHVNLKPGVTWYLRFGKCLLGASHGHTMKAEGLAGAMACDCPEDWGLTIHRHAWMGHIHHETSKEVNGVRVESLNSPAAPDAWNASKFRSNRALSAITFHQENGELGRHRVNIVAAK